MARNAIDIRRTVLASVLPMGFGIILVIFGIILQLLTIVITDSNQSTISLISTIYQALLIPLFLLIFFWSGMRSAKRFNFDAVGAGTVAALAYIIVAFLQLVLDIVLSIVVVSRGVVGAGFSSPEGALASSLFTGTAGLSGVALSAVCGVGIIAIGATVNFVIGGLGALFALRKTVQKED